MNLLFGLQFCEGEVAVVAYGLGEEPGTELSSLLAVRGIFFFFKSLCPGSLEAAPHLRA